MYYLAKVGYLLLQNNQNLNFSDRFINILALNFFENCEIPFHKIQNSVLFYFLYICRNHSVKHEFKRIIRKNT